MGELVFFIFLGGLVFGLIGLGLGSTVGKKVAGFWLGAFLGPIGWIITFLLPREEGQQTAQIVQLPPAPEASDEPPCERDLSIDAYKIWLVTKYAIEKNDVLDQFACSDRLFDSRDDALAFADELEQRKVAERQAAQEAESAKRARELEEKAQIEEQRLAAERQRQTERREAFKRQRPKLAGALVLTVCVIAGWQWMLFEGHKLALLEYEQAEAVAERARLYPDQYRRSQVAINLLSDQVARASRCWQVWDDGGVTVDDYVQTLWAACGKDETTGRCAYSLKEAKECVTDAIAALAELYRAHEELETCKGPCPPVYQIFRLP